MVTYLPYNLFTYLQLINLQFITYNLQFITYNLFTYLPYNLFTLYLTLTGAQNNCPIKPIFLSQTQLTYT